MALKRAALLLFHDDPERFVSGAFVKIGFFRSESDLAYHDEVRGDLFTQVASTIESLRAKYLKAAIRYEGLQRMNRFRARCHPAPCSTRWCTAIMQWVPCADPGV